MPMTRSGGSQLMDAIEECEDALALVKDEADRDLADDGVLDVEKAQRFFEKLRATQQALRLVAQRGMATDQSLCLIRGLAHSGDIMAPQVQRSFREFTQDRQRLDAHAPVVLVVSEVMTSAAD